MPTPQRRAPDEQKLRRSGGASENRNEEGFLKPSRIFEARTLPSVFPALGRGVSRDYCAHSKDLLAQKVSLFAPPDMLKAMYGPL